MHLAIQVTRSLQNQLPAVAQNLKRRYCPAMFITGLGTAAPARTYTQAQCWEALQGSTQFAKLTPRSRAILRKVLTGNNGIATRHLAFDHLNEAFDLTP